MIAAGIAISHGSLDHGKAADHTHIESTKNATALARIARRTVRPPEVV
jgi:hypothetical protein